LKQRCHINSRGKVADKDPDFPKLIRQLTSLDSMSPANPALLTLADIHTAPGVKAHSIIAINGK